LGPLNLIDILVTDRTPAADLGNAAGAEVVVAS